MAASVLFTVGIAKGVAHLLKLVRLMLDLEGLILFESFVAQAGEHLENTVAQVAVT